MTRYLYVPRVLNINMIHLSWQLTSFTYFARSVTWSNHCLQRTLSIKDFFLRHCDNTVGFARDSYLASSSPDQPCISQDVWFTVRGRMLDILVAMPHSTTDGSDRLFHRIVRFNDELEDFIDGTYSARSLQLGTTEHDNLLNIDGNLDFRNADNILRVPSVDHTLAPFASTVSTMASPKGH